MTPKQREDLNWIQGVVIGVAASMGENDLEKKEVLRAAGRVIESMLRNDREVDHETQSD